MVERKVKVSTMQDITAVLITTNRERLGCVNYLGETLANLKGSIIGCRLHSLNIFATPGDESWAEDMVVSVCIDATVSTGDQPANLNVTKALEYVEATGTAWGLFLEDDIDVIADFFDGVGLWLDNNAVDDVDLYPLGASYPNIEDLFRQGKVSSWEYPVTKFYGTQAIVIRREVIGSLTRYIRDNVYECAPDGTSYDILMSKWARLRGAQYFLTPVPSFIQHIGERSVIRPRDKVHKFFWPGRYYEHGIHLLSPYVTA